MRSATTLFIGPDGRGRDFRIRAQAPAGDPVAATEEVLGLPLHLAGWAESGETEFSACLPLKDGGAIVLRGHNAGPTESGYACYGHAVILPARLFTDQIAADILAAIPVPDGKDRFARQPLSIEALTPAIAPRHDWTGLQPRHHLRCVIVGDDVPPEMVISSVLAAHAPVHGESPMTWASSAYWARMISGTRLPALLVLPQSRAANLPTGFAPARMTDAGFDGAHLDLPSATRVRDLFLRQVSGHADPTVLGRLNTAPPDRPPADTLFEVATAVLTPVDYSTALGDILAFAAIPAKEYDGVFRTLARQLFGWFLNQDRHRSMLIQTLQVLDLPENRVMAANLGSPAAYLFDSPQMLDEALMSRLLTRPDVLAALEARPDLEQVLSALHPAAALRVYDGLLGQRSDIAPGVAASLTTASIPLFRAARYSDVCALLRRNFDRKASAAKAQLLIDLVLAFSRSDLPGKVRHG